MVPRLTCVKKLGIATISPSAFFKCSVYLPFVDTMTWGCSLKAATNNERITLSILEYPLVHLASAHKMPFLPADSWRRFLMMASSPCGQGALWHAKHTCTITLAWHTSHLLWQGSAEGEHHLNGIALLVCCSCVRVFPIAISLHQARGLHATKFVSCLHF